MTPLIPIRFRQSDSPFYRTLKKRVREHFVARKLSRYAGPAMYLKAAIILTTFFATYTMILANWFTGAVLVAALVVMHFSMFLTTIGIAHDAAHGAYIRSRLGNRAITVLFDLLGINSHYWIKTHVHSHHAAPNVPLHDSAIESFALVRLHPKTPRRPWHAYQHIYTFGVYALVTIFQMYFLELVSFRQNVTGFRRGDKHSRVRIASMYLSKAFVLFYSLVLPLMVVEAPAWQVVTGALLGHAVCGLAIGIIFQTTHLAEGTTFPEPDAAGFIDNSYAEHILATTADFSPRNPVVTWFAGGLNIHVAHHLFPGISQAHLQALARIVRETANEHGVPYRELTLFEAVRSHVRTLKRLGAAPSYEGTHQHL